MASLELRVPPPALMIGCAVLMGLVARALPVARIAFPHHRLLAAALVAAGLATGACGAWSIRRARTTLSPTRPDDASALVVSGIYRVTRNPMYLGLVLVLLAWAAYLSNPATLVPVGLFILYLTRFQILPEERILGARFGADYAAYRRRVRRWL